MMAVRDYFENIKTFSELTPEERLKVLFTILKEGQGITTKELISKFPKLPESSIRDRLSELSWAGLFEYKYPAFARPPIITPTPKGRVVLERGYLTLEDFEGVPEWLIRRLTRKPRKVKRYRISMVWMFYAKEIKRYTPHPFAEFRAFVVTKRPDLYKPTRFRKILFSLVNLFPSVMHSWRSKRIYLGDESGEAISAKITGLEREVIESEEVREVFESTGLENPKMDEIYRYVAFFKKRPIRIPAEILKKFIPIFEQKSSVLGREYNEADIRRIERRIDRLRDEILTILERQKDFISTSEISRLANTTNFMLVNSILFELRRQGRVRMVVRKVRGKNYLFWRLRR